MTKDLVGANAIDPYEILRHSKNNARSVMLANLGILLMIGK